MDTFSIVALLPLVFILLAMGSFAGLCAGLLGIGGGIVLVPTLYYSFVWLGFEQALMMHVSVATSFAIMIPTGLSSARAHWKKESVRIDLVKNIGAGIIIGVIIGTLIAGHISGRSLQMIFSVALLVLAMVMLSDPERFSAAKKNPNQPWVGGVGMIMGCLASLMGIGGAIMSVPFMTACKVPMHKAIGTASALGMVISIPALFAYIYMGLGEEGRPPFSLGYANFLAWIIITPASVMMAPVGAGLAHKLPAKRLRKIFACLLMFLAARMLYSAIYG